MGLVLLKLDLQEIHMPLERPSYTPFNASWDLPSLHHFVTRS